MMNLETILQKVTLNHQAIQKLAESLKNSQLPLSDWKIPQLPQTGNSLADYQFLLLINSINFCFIAVDDRPRWRYAKSGDYGAFGMFTALRDARALFTNDDGTISAAKLGALSETQVAGIFAGQSDCGEMPLLKERVGIFHEVASGLANFDFQTREISREQFITNLETAFPSYRDVLYKEGQLVEVAKRSQLLLSMLAGRGIVTVTNPEAVDLFADYRVPQVLNDMGLITYPKELQKKLQAGDLLQEGEELESEIRIATLATGRVLRAALKKLGHVTDCMRLDFFFWMKSKELVEPLPFHKCFTIKY